MRRACRLGVRPRWSGPFRSNRPPGGNSDLLREPARSNRLPIPKPDNWRSTRITCHGRCGKRHSEKSSRGPSPPTWRRLTCSAHGHQSSHRCSIAICIRSAMPSSAGSAVRRRAYCSTVWSNGHSTPLMNTLAHTGHRPGSMRRRWSATCSRPASLRPICCSVVNSVWCSGLIPPVPVHAIP